MRIKVQWQDIWQGRRWDSTSCAVARAIQRQAPGLVTVSVGNGAITGFWQQGLSHQSLNDFLRRKIKAFDRWHIVWPFGFELTLPAIQAVVAAPAEKSLDEMLREELVAV